MRGGSPASATVRATSRISSARRRPCVKARENPILYSYNTKAEGCLSGPGHQTVFERGGRQFLVFHAWSATPGCTPARKVRFMYIAPLMWRGDAPVLGNSLRR